MSHPISASQDWSLSIVVSPDGGDMIAGPVEHESAVVLRAWRPPQLKMFASKWLAMSYKGPTATMRDR